MADIIQGTTLRTVPMNISVKEAQKQLPELLDRVADGEQITITREGKPDVRLSLKEAAPHDPRQIEAAIAQIRDLRRGQSITPQEIKQLIDEGRRF